MVPDVGYEPVSVKDVLSEMKDTAELLIDLSYSAVLSGSDEVAEEVLTLEERMDVLQLQARMSVLMASRSPEDAEQLAPVLGVIGAAEKIANAAGDIAKVVLEEIGLPNAMQAAIPEANEVLMRVTVGADSRYVGRTLGAINMGTENGVRAIAVRRASETGKRAWITNPDRETEILAADVVLLRGPDEGLATVYERATGDAYEPPEPVEPPIEDLERAVYSIITMKNMSELAVDLAYGSILFNSEGVAEEVVELEAEVDALKSRFEAWTLQAAGRVEDPVELRGLVHLASATEVISDAALEISEGVLRGLDAHPVVAAAVEESDEVIVRYTVADDAEIANRTLGQLELHTETGMRIIAIRRPGDETSWVVSPDATTELAPGDVLVAKGTRAGAEGLSELAGDPQEFAA